MSGDSNPYLPPRAPVEDPAPAWREPPSMPRIVRVGLGFLYAHFAIEAVRVLAVLSEFLRLPAMIIGALTIAVLGLLIWMMGHGRNWARLAYGVVLFFDVLLSFGGSLSVGGLIELLLQAIGLGLLFAPRSNDWFRSPAN